jgi:GT2 family glycosyltransferase
MGDPSIGICGYKLLFPDDSNDPNRPAGKVQHIGMASNIRGDMIHPLIGWSPDNPKCNVSREVLAVTGASFIVRRDIFQRVGGFDPIFGKGYYEDMDLCFKIRSAGKRVFVDTNAVATHGVGQTFKSNEPPPIQQNQQIFKLRWWNSMPWSEFEIW